MKPASRPLHALLRYTLAAALLAALTAAAAEAQARWTPDPKASLAWWQVNPHLNHLWATTCPEEPSWRPGEGRSGGWVIDQALSPAKQGHAAVSDTTIIPLYPRRRVRSVCAEAVTGQVVVANPRTWQGVTGEIVVKAATLIGGDNRRDLFTREAILQTGHYPEIKFRIDSVVGVTQQSDTLRGTAVGVFTARAVDRPMTANVRAWPEAGGLRVVGRFNVPAQDLVSEYNISKFALGLGVATAIWHQLWMGVDLLLRPETGGGN